MCSQSSARAVDAAVSGLLREEGSAAHKEVGNEQQQQVSPSVAWALLVFGILVMIGGTFSVVTELAA